MSQLVPRTAAPTQRPVLVPRTFDQLVTFAQMAADSDLMPKDYKGKPANIMIAVQMGSELGLAPMQSLQSIAVINGRPGIWGDGMIGLCRQSPLCQDIREHIEGQGDARTAICVATRRGSSPCTGRFSVADARRANLFGKAGPWQQYPDRMLQQRARGFALRDAFPDLLRGLKTVEELRDYPDQAEQMPSTPHPQIVGTSDDVTGRASLPPPDKLAALEDALGLEEPTADQQEQDSARTEAPTKQSGPMHFDAQPGEDDYVPPAPPPASPLDDLPPPTDDEPPRRAWVRWALDEIGYMRTLAELRSFNADRDIKREVDELAQDWPQLHGILVNAIAARTREIGKVKA